MKKFIVLFVLSGLGMSVAEAQSTIGVVMPKSLFSCEYKGRNGEFVMKRDILSIDIDNAERVARVSEMGRMPYVGTPSRWVLLSDLDLSKGDIQSQTPIANPSSTFALGITVDCKPSTQPAKPIYGKFRILPKRLFNCSYAGKNSHKLVMSKNIEGVNESHAITLARISEMRYVDPSVPGKERWALLSDIYSNNIAKNPLYFEGLNAFCQSTDQQPALQ